ncbi:uncharacterized protein MONOS_6373 [Monocercomonoides exilis]|uniref:uncharacterized protein n=1 Tax=Monocercomonoides exilis TaxID=2049356 RepID=UPI00355940C0|nr:hypothetical protein MONOS_6373 [Monocercomonoides exilis]|eukprot:MONOS_6373.1-p1 / transcript=MONOS_6373.1 / gene=MONOS_6373 / organism=Monocercomonoides_exilis_PA203 / gene_product=unspecified product / transcript_product=unspecified product / location=Mono_scaffold00200:10239-11129(+) / protein_length=273 / sequence_SO=supercontig / SO=protein_coding / is_pseudo=false
MADEGMCEICKKQEWKYKCPECGVRTCCVECVKKHKEQSGCTGKRQPQQFVRLSEMNVQTMVSDLHFLESMALEVERAKRKEKEAKRPSFVPPENLVRKMQQARKEIKIGERGEEEVPAMPRFGAKPILYEAMMSELEAVEASMKESSVKREGTQQSSKGALFQAFIAQEKRDGKDKSKDDGMEEVRPQKQRHLAENSYEQASGEQKGEKVVPVLQPAESAPVPQGMAGYYSPFCYAPQVPFQPFSFGAYLPQDYYDSFAATMHTPAMPQPPQ